MDDDESKKRAAGVLALSGGEGPTTPPPRMVARLHTGVFKGIHSHGGLAKTCTYAAGVRHARGRTWYRRRLMQAAEAISKAELDKQDSDERLVETRESIKALMVQEAELLRRSLELGARIPQLQHESGTLERLLADHLSPRSPPISYECPICYDTLVNPVTTSCGHTSCERCLALWLKRPVSIVRCPAGCDRVLPLALPSVNVILRETIRRTLPLSYRDRAAAVEAEEVVDNVVASVRQKVRSGRLGRGPWAGGGGARGGGNVVVGGGGDGRNVAGVFDPAWPIGQHAGGGGGGVGAEQARGRERTLVALLFLLCLLTGLLVVSAGSLVLRGGICWALERNNTVLARVLIEHNLNPRAGCSGGETPLHYAAALGDFELVHAIVDHGGDVDVLNSQGRTALAMATSRSSSSGSSRRKRSGAHGSGRGSGDGRGKDGGSNDDENEGALARRVVKTLLALGADPNRAGSSNDTPLYLAAAAFNNDLVKVLSNSGARVDENALLCYRCSGMHEEGVCSCYLKT